MRGKSKDRHVSVSQLGTQEEHIKTNSLFRKREYRRECVYARTGASRHKRIFVYQNIRARLILGAEIIQWHSARGGHTSSFASAAFGFRLLIRLHSYCSICGMTTMDPLPTLHFLAWLASSLFDKDGYANTRTNERKERRKTSSGRSALPSRVINPTTLWRFKNSEGLI